MELDLENLAEVRVEKDGVWHVCRPFVVSVSGGKVVIYTTEAGVEIKRETLSRYKWRLARRKKG